MTDFPDVIVTVGTIKGVPRNAHRKMNKRYREWQGLYSTPRSLSDRVVWGFLSRAWWLV